MGQIKAYEFAVSDKVSMENQEPAIFAGNPADRLHSLQLSNIHFHYPNQPVLNDFSLQIEKSQFIGITGESGKGKTTILNLILGFLTPAGGSILIDQAPVSPKDIKKYWPQISYVRQQPFFIHDTLLRNITLEENGYDKENLHAAIGNSGLDEFITKFPEGLAMIITENGKNISGGQQQRVQIARALYKNAQLILLDEPFNELDEDSTLSLLAHFQRLAQNGKSVIMITHDKKCLSYCNKIVSLDEP
jgi:ABC-type bacteriocin/lantibiotic exporter with double-glycine peptidase domain